MVADLINLDLHIWRNEEVMATIHREEAEAICQIPLSRRDVNDDIIWLHNSKGLFIGKSAYHVARKLLNDGNRVGTSRGCAKRKMWTTIWKLKLPNKIKIFGWWAYHDIRGVQWVEDPINPPESDRPEAQRVDPKSIAGRIRF